MLYSLPKKLNNINNHYIALTEVMVDYNQGPALLSLLELIKRNSNADINENLFSSELFNVNYKDQGVIIFSRSVLEDFRKINFDSEWNWGSGKPEQIFNLLKNIGLDFTKKTISWKLPNSLVSHFDKVFTPDEFYSKVKELNVTPTYSDPIFEIKRNPDDHDICIFRHVYSQMKQDEFNERITESKTLHNAVILGRDKFIQFLIDECKIDVNIKDRYGNSALLECRNISTLKLLNSYDLDWTVTDGDGNDCLTRFAKISSKEDSKEMLDLAHKEIGKTVNKESGVSASDILKKRVNKTLLDMVEANKTKKELEDYIKKYKVTITGIFDKDETSLAQICIRNQSWARYNLLKEYYPLDHVNTKGVGTLEMLFRMDSISHQNQAIIIFNELLNNSVHIKTPQFSANILVNAFKHQKKLSLPSWFIGKVPYKQFFEKFIGSEHAEKWNNSYSDIGSSVRWGHYSNISNESLKEAEGKVFFFLTHASLYNKDFDVNQLPISKMFSESKNASMNSISYTFSTHALENFIGLINVIDNNEHLKCFNYQEIWKRFEQDAVQHILKSIYQSKKDTYNSMTSLISHNNHLLHFLLDKKSELFLSVLTDDFIKNFSIDIQLEGKMKYNLLNEKIPNKENILEVKKPKKI